MNARMFLMPCRPNSFQANSNSTIALKHDTFFVNNKYKRLEQAARFIVRRHVHGRLLASQVVMRMKKVHMWCRNQWLQGIEHYNYFTNSEHFNRHHYLRMLLKNGLWCEHNTHCVYANQRYCLSHWSITILKQHSFSSHDYIICYTGQKFCCAFSFHSCSAWTHDSIERQTSTHNFKRRRCALQGTFSAQTSVRWSTF